MIRKPKMYRGKRCERAYLEERHSEGRETSAAGSKNREQPDQERMLRKIEQLSRGTEDVGAFPCQEAPERGEETRDP